jgi:N-acetyl-alpha-D-muramate 1-phosphate uridylyltransferase
MILAAGRGERLRPLTDKTPKPLLDIRGEPLVVHQLRWLAAAGIREIVINLRHLGTQISTRLGDGTAFGVQIRYSIETAPLETGGGIQCALPLLGEAPFAIVNGDIWTDYAFDRLPTTLGGELAHLVLAPRSHGRGDFGLEQGRVTRATVRPYTYCGIAVIAPELFADAPPPPFSLRELLFTAVAADRVSGEVWSGRWTDIGTPDQLASLRQSAD